MNSSEANKKNLEYWDKLHKDYERDKIEVDDWMWVFNKTIEESRGPVIDLGCGSGNDTLYLLNKGKNVFSCDGSMNAVLNMRKNFPEIEGAICFDMLNVFPFGNNTTDLVVADLCLHYFTTEDTIKILKEIRRILVNRGHLLFRVNSMNDINHGAGQGLEVETHLYMTEDGRYKRFFDAKDIYEMFNIFDIKYVREETMKRYKLEKKTYVVDAKNIK